MYAVKLWLETYGPKKYAIQILILNYGINICKSSIEILFNTPNTKS